MTTTDAVRTYLAAQVARMRAEEAALLAAEPEAIHDARVACRRVRSTLRTFPALASDERRRDLDDRLHAWSETLGVVRDLEVLAELLAQVCSEGLLAALTPRLDAAAGEGRAAVAAELMTPAHRALLEDLEAVVLSVPSGRVHPRRRAKAAARRAGRRLARAGDDPDALHSARKAAKRARYAAEAVGDEETADHQKAVQGALGDHHDCIVALRRLDDFGLPDEMTAQTRVELERRAAEALARLPDAGLR